MAEVAARLGFHGIDLTVRKGGHVLPENVIKGLPKAVDAARKEGISIPMITTDIVDPEHPLTEDILSTASYLGIKYYRLGRLLYNRSMGIHQNLDTHKRTLDKLIELNRKYKINGCIQNHSGPYRMVGAPVWDLYYLLKNFDPEFLGVQYDIMHATVEGAYSWLYGLKLVAPWIKTIDIKDFKWVETSPSKWEDEIVPLGTGMVNFKRFLEEIERLNISATYSIHYEYNLGGAEHGLTNPDMEPAIIYQNVKKDLNSFFELMPTK